MSAKGLEGWCRPRMPKRLHFQRKQGRMSRCREADSGNLHLLDVGVRTQLIAERWDGNRGQRPTLNVEPNFLPTSKISELSKNNEARIPLGLGMVVG